MVCDGNHLVMDDIIRNKLKLYILSFMLTSQYIGIHIVHEYKDQAYNVCLYTPCLLI